MLKFILRTFRFLFSPLATWLNRLLGKKVYWLLALVLSVLALVDLGYVHYTGGMSKTTFDNMMRKRVIVPQADPDIVIVDINEASLSAMAKEYGRWPWPRQVLAEFVENVERQQPRAIMFDILFSDPDVYNPDSDAYFDEVIKATRNTYFPMLRLPRESDAQSQLKPAMLPGARPIAGQAQTDQTIAMIMPFFRSVMAGGRLGTHNIYVEGDSIARRYIVLRNEYGWRVPSLPARLVADLGVPVPEAEDMLINWRGEPFSYHTVSFSDVFMDFLNEHHKRPANEFAGKVVIIGSTAPSLFDIKATPMASLHPGVEILATATDNLKNRDYLKEQPVWVTLVISVLFIWGAALAFYYRKASSSFDKVFGGVQLGFLGLSYVVLNLSSWYIDMTVPIAMALLYFSVARGYAFFCDEILQEGQLFMVGPLPGQRARFDLLIAQRHTMDTKATVRFEALLADVIERSRANVRRVNCFADDKGLFVRTFKDTLILYWLTDPGIPGMSIEADIEQLRTGITEAATAAGGTVVCHHHCADLTGSADDNWKQTARHIVAQALLEAQSTR